MISTADAESFISPHRFPLIFRNVEDLRAQYKRSRSWEDMRKYGFLAAGGGRAYPGKLEKLEVGASVDVHLKQEGYVGFGRVVAPKRVARDVIIGRAPLLSLPLEQPTLAHDPNDQPQFHGPIITIVSGTGSLMFKDRCGRI